MVIFETAAFTKAIVIGRKEQIFMLLAYPKNVQDDLTPDQKRLLAALVKKELGNG